MAHLSVACTPASRVPERKTLTFAISSIARMFPDANFTIGHGLPRLAVAAISLVALEASSQPSHQPADQEKVSIVTMKDDLANRSCVRPTRA